MPNPANTSKLFQQNPRNELGKSWIFLNIQAKVELGLSGNSNFIFPAGILGAGFDSVLSDLGEWAESVKSTEWEQTINVCSIKV